MAASLITFLYLSYKCLNLSSPNIFFIILIISFTLSNIQVLFLNNLSWIFAKEPSDLKLSVFSRLRLVFNREVYKKNIFYGDWGDKNVVMKEYPVGNDCLGLDSEECWLKYRNYVMLSDELKSLVVCPTVENFQDVGIWRNLSFESTTESLILEMLPSNGSWPIPKSLGILGNVLIVEYVGPMLSSLSVIDWTIKAKIAVELLEMARVFTFGHERFSFYFTDISPDNIAIRDNLDVVLIDLDHVIVVDRLAFGSTQSLHISEIALDGVFMFSTRDVCKHSVSDLNYYSVCEHIFRHSTVLSNEWLLTGLPDNVEKKYPLLRGLLEECAEPVLTNDRIAAGKALEKELRGMFEL